MGIDYSYPRTYHLRGSPGVSRDDKVMPLSDAQHFFVGPRIVLSEKLDGTTAGFMTDEVFARSHHAPTKLDYFSEAKALHALIRGRIPRSVCVYGEWLAKKHSIHYTEISTAIGDLYQRPNYYFHIFAIRAKDSWRSWDQVTLFAKSVQVPTVPILWRGRVDNVIQLQKIVGGLADQKSLYGYHREGVVGRLASGFTHGDAEGNRQLYGKVFKWVRKGHVTSPTHHRKNRFVQNL